MRKCILGMLCVVAALMVSPVTAMASNDTASGSGSTTAFPYGGDPSGPAPARVKFSSQANFNGSEPSGSMTATVGANTYTGDVTCVQVNGSAAVVGGYIEHASPSETLGGAPPPTV
jgi:hypothetical protein